jgi:hypothetical protein
MEVALRLGERNALTQYSIEEDERGNALVGGALARALVLHSQGRVNNLKSKQHNETHREVHRPRLPIRRPGASRHHQFR